MDVVNSLRQSLTRLSLRRSMMREAPAKKDDLSNSIIQFRGVSVQFLESFVRDLESSKIGPDIELVQLKQRVDGVDDEGATVQVVERSGGVLKVRTKMSDKVVSLKADQARKRGREAWSLGDVCSFVLAEESKSLMKAYVQIMESRGETDNVGKPFQGAYVSVARESSLKGLVECMKIQCTRNRKPIEKQFVWLDVFGVNFGRLDGNESELLTSLELGIKEFDAHWVYIGLWDDPVPLHRMWCGWEIRQMGNGAIALLHDEEHTDILSKGQIDAILRTILNGRMYTASYVQENRLLAHTKAENIQNSVYVAAQNWMIQSTVHTLSVIRSKSHPTGTDLASLLCRAGDVILFVLKEQATDVDHQNQVHIAIKYYSEALSLYKKAGKPLKEAEVYTKMATAHEDLRELDLALSRFKKAFFIHKQNNDARNVALTLSSIANVLVMKNKFDKALEKYEQACLVMLLIKDKDPLLVADTIVNTANVLAYQRKYDAALKKYDQALIIRREKVGAHDPAVADIINSIANVQASQSKLDAALKNYRKALEIYERAYGDTHLTVFVALNNIAVILNDQGNPDQALKILKQALAIVSEAGREEQYKEQHRSKRRQSTATLASNITNIESLETPDVAVTYNNMAVCFDRQGRYDKSLEKYNQALMICKERLGPTHFKVANIHLNIGISYLESQHKKKEAAVELQKALAIYQNTFGENHPDTKECKELLKRCA